MFSDAWSFAVSWSISFLASLGPETDQPHHSRLTLMFAIFRPIPRPTLRPQALARRGGGSRRPILVTAVRQPDMAVRLSPDIIAMECASVHEKQSEHCGICPGTGMRGSNRRGRSDVYRAGGVADVRYRPYSDRRSKPPAVITRPWTNPSVSTEPERASGALKYMG